MVHGREERVGGAYMTWGIAYTLHFYNMGLKQIIAKSATFQENKKSKKYTIWGYQVQESAGGGETEPLSPCR